MNTKKMLVKEKSLIGASLRYALKYIKGGWHVLPLYSVTKDGCTCGVRDCPNAGKHPRTHHGVKDASLDEKLVRGWFSRWPHANVGIRTGKVSGLVVLDVDPRNGGGRPLNAPLTVFPDKCQSARSSPPDLARHDHRLRVLLQSLCNSR